MKHNHKKSITLFTVFALILVRRVLAGTGGFSGRAEGGRREEESAGCDGYV